MKAKHLGATAAVLAWLGTGTAGAAGAPYLVKDIDAGAAKSGGRPRFLGAAGPQVYFSSDVGVLATDGTAAGTAPFTDDALAATYGTVDGLFYYLTAVYGADSATYTLWCTDGTAGGAIPLATFDSYLDQIGVFDGRLLLQAYRPDGTVETWITDGTPAGTELLATGNFERVQEFAGGLIYKITDESVWPLQQELWFTTGTAASSVRLTTLEGERITSFPESTDFAANGLWLFSTTDAETYAQRLWATDGTPEGTTPIQAFAPGASPAVSGPTVLGNGALFTVSAFGAAGYSIGLWVTDGTEAGTMPIADVGPSGVLTRFGDRVYYPGYDAVHGMELWTSDGTAAGTHLVRDIRPGSDPSNPKSPASSSPAYLVAIGGQLYFTADDGTGPQFWTTDGTADGTVPVTASMPANTHRESGNPFNFQLVGSTVLYYPASGGPLWQFTPGADTTLLKDLGEGAGGGVRGFTGSVGGRILLTACTTNRGLELWSTDGTAAGTVPLEVAPGPGPSCSTPQNRQASTVATLGDTYYFSVDDGAHGRELWKTDGTPAGTLLVKDVNVGAGDGIPDFSGFSAIVHDGRIFFAGAAADTGLEPWITDGTAAGTHLIRDLVLGNDASDPAEITALPDGRVVFAADDGVHAKEPWVSDGTAAGTFLLADIVTPANAKANQVPFNSSDPARFFALDGAVLFGARVDPVHDCGVGALWRTDGTAAGTQLVKHIAESCGVSPTTTSYPRPLIQHRGAMLLDAADRAHGHELWRTDGTADGTYLVADLDPAVAGSVSASSSPYGMFQWKNDLYFGASVEPGGTEPWRLDGDLSDPAPLGDLFPGSRPYWGSNDSSPTGFEKLRNALYFGASDAQGGGLWTTDGSAQGTTLVKRICTSSGSSACSALNGAPVRLGNKLLFSADDGQNGRELWVSDGTADGTHLLVDLYPGATEIYPGYSVANAANPSDFVLFDDALFFVATTPAYGRELWRTNGTAGGTALVADINPGPASSTPHPYVAGGALFLSAENAAVGRELWRTDGTAGGTELVADLAAGPSSSNPSAFAVAGHRLFFAATDAVPGDNHHGNELWALPLAH